MNYTEGSPSNLKRVCAYALFGVLSICMSMHGSEESSSDETKSNVCSDAEKSKAQIKAEEDLKKTDKNIFKLAQKLGGDLLISRGLKELFDKRVAQKARLDELKRESK